MLQCLKQIYNQVSGIDALFCFIFSKAVTYRYSAVHVEESTVKGDSGDGGIDEQRLSFPLEGVSHG